MSAHVCIMREKVRPAGRSQAFKQRRILKRGDKLSISLTTPREGLPPKMPAPSHLSMEEFLAKSEAQDLMTLLAESSDGCSGMADVGGAWETVFDAVVQQAHEARNVKTLMGRLQASRFSVIRLAGCEALSDTDSDQFASLCRKRLRAWSQGHTSGPSQGSSSTSQSDSPKWPIVLSPPDAVHPDSYLEPPCVPLSTHMRMAIRVVINGLAELVQNGP